MTSNFTDVLLVGFDNHKPDQPIIVIGRKGKNNDLYVLKAFKGQKAIDIYNTLADVNSFTEGEIE